MNVNELSAILNTGELHGVKIMCVCVHLTYCVMKVNIGHISVCTCTYTFKWFCLDYFCLNLVSSNKVYSNFCKGKGTTFCP
jgi:hypothetical protein